MDKAEPLVDGSTADALEALRWDWGESYLIEIDGVEWRARRGYGLGGWIEADCLTGWTWRSGRTKPCGRSRTTGGR